MLAQTTFQVLGNQVFLPESEVESRIQIEKVPKKVVLAFAPSRSGTSAFLKVFEPAVDLLFYQPIKSLIRYGEPELVLNSSQQTIFIKECFGPSRVEECTFNPLQILLNAGLPKENLMVISLAREPIATYDSWLEHFPKTSLQAFVSAYENLEKIREQVIQAKIPMVTYVYEVLKLNPPEVVIPKLFQKLGLTYQPQSVFWESSEYHSSLKISLGGDVRYPEFEKIILRSVMNSHKYFYRSRTLKFLTQREQESIQNSSVAQIYKKLKHSCEQEFDLKIDAESSAA